MKYVNLFLNNLRISILCEMSHKTNFIMRFISDSIYFFVYFIFYTVIFSYVPRINEWGKYEVLLLMGTFHIVISLFLAFFFPNLVRFPNLVKSGELDGILVKPMNSQYLLSTQVMDIGSLTNVLLGLSIVIYSGMQLEIKVSFISVVLFAAYILLGVFIMYGILFIMVSSVFWLSEASWSIGFFMSFNSFGDKPVSFYKGVIYRFLIYIFPIGIVANVPASVIMNQETNYMEVWMMIIAFILYLLSIFVWDRGLKLYEGGSI